MPELDGLYPAAKAAIGQSVRCYTRPPKSRVVPPVMRQLAMPLPLQTFAKQISQFRNIHSRAQDISCLGTAENDMTNAYLYLIENPGLTVCLGFPGARTGLSIAIKY